MSDLVDSIRKEEDERTMLARRVTESVLRVMNWNSFLMEVRRFCPEARLVSHIHDEWMLDKVDLEDPHFKRHLDAFKARVLFECDEPMCIVGDVHDR